LRYFHSNNRNKSKKYRPFVVLNIAVNHPALHENKLIWAIICSMLLHALLVVVIPNIKFDDIKTPEILEVDFVKLPEPPPPSPEPVQPLPEIVKPKIEPKIKPKPVIKPTPIPVIERNEPVTEPPPSQPTEVIAVAPKPTAAPPVQTVPVPVKQEPPPVTNQADAEDARNKYGNALWGAISKHKKYPKIAAMRGWQGEAIVELELDGSGKLKSKKIIQSSGHDVLDRQALEMVEKALPFPAPPDALRGTSFTITVPVPFKLE
jgi:protein TonB